MNMIFLVLHGMISVHHDHIDATVFHKHEVFSVLYWLFDFGYKPH